MGEGEDRFRQAVNRFYQRAAVSMLPASGSILPAILDQVAMAQQSLVMVQQLVMVHLHREMAAVFDEEELRQLCFELNVKWDDLAGDVLDAKIRSLLELVIRNGRLDDLLLLVMRQRPSVRL